MESGVIFDDVIIVSFFYKEGLVGFESVRLVVKLMYVIYVIVSVRLYVDNEFGCIIKEDWEFFVRIDVDYMLSLLVGLESIYKNIGFKNFL